MTKLHLFEKVSTIILFIACDTYLIPSTSLGSSDWHLDYIFWIYGFDESECRQLLQEPNPPETNTAIRFVQLF